MSEPDDDGGIVEHDPLAEAADLLTLREARARLTEELRSVRRQLGVLEGVASPGAALAEARARREHLEQALARFSPGPPQ